MVVLGVVQGQWVSEWLDDPVVASRGFLVESQQPADRCFIATRTRTIEHELHVIDHTGHDAFAATVDAFRIAHLTASSQYSLGSKTQVEERSASVMTQMTSP